MADRFLVLLLSLKFEYHDFLAAPGAANSSFHSCARKDLAAISEGGLGGQLDLGAWLTGNLLHADDIARGHPVLFSACFNNCVHANLFGEPEHTSCAGKTRLDFEFTTTESSISNAEILV